MSHEDHHEWCECGCEHESHQVSDVMIAEARTPYMLSVERTLTYNVVFKSALKTNGKAVPESEVLKWIDDGLAIAYGDKLGINFSRTSTRPLYTFQVRYDPARYAGSYYHRGDIVLNTQDPRGWPLRKVMGVACHELGHSSDFFGLGHLSSTFTSTVSGKKKTYTHLMHPYVGNFPTFTSPYETGRLIPRYGKHIEPPKPEPPKPEPEPPTPPKPEPEPEPPTPEPPKPDPALLKERKDLQAERKVKQGLRETYQSSLEQARKDSVEYRAKLDKAREDVVDYRGKYQDNEAAIKAINVRIGEINKELEEFSKE